ncbi:8245_t:CDS:2, partial [Racocetra fulgida]
ALAKDKLDTCMKAQKEKVRIHLDECEQILQVILKSSRKRVGNNETCINQYDIRDHSDSYPSCGTSWPYDLKTVSAYLRRSDVIGAIHASAQQIGWTECNSGVGHGFDNDPSPPAVQDLTENHWFVNDKLVGHMLSERNLTYMVVHNASHMVPYDEPGVSMSMMYWFIGIDKHIETKYSSKFKLGSDTTTPTSNPNGTIYNGEDSEILNRYYNATELVIETPLNSEDIDHFGDSDEEDNHDHDRSPLTSRARSDQNN